MFETFFNILPGYSIVLDRRLQVLAISQDWLKSLGLSRESVVGRDVFSAMPNHKYFFDQWKESLEKILHTCAPHEIVTSNSQFFHTQTGLPTPMSWRMSQVPVLDSSGQVQSIVIRAEAIDHAASALDVAQIGEWKIDLVTGLTETSSLHDLCFGFNEPQLDWTLKKALERIIPEDQVSFHRAYDETLKTGSDLRVDFRVLWPDGSLHWLTVRGRIQKDTDNKPRQLAGLIWDITEAKKVEGQIVDVLESMSDAFFSVNKEWVITRINSQHEKLTVHKREDQIGKNFLELFLYTPEHRTSKYWVSYHKAMEERVPVAFEDYYEPFDLWTSVRVFPTADGGLAVFFTDTTTQNRTTQKLASEKQKFEAIFVESPTPMALLRGPDFVFEKANPEYIALMGGRSLIEKSLLRALPELEGQPFLDLMKNVYKTGEPFIGREMVARLIRRSGGEPEDTYFDFNYTRVNDGEGRPYGIYIHAIDITEKVLARKKIELLAASLQDAVQARDEFLSIASHELKTPLTSMKLNNHLTLREIALGQGKPFSPEQIKTRIEQSEKQVNRLVRLIDDMLDMSRIRSGKLTIEKELFNLTQVIKESVERMAPQFVSLKAAAPTFESEGEVWRQWDQMRIEQVVANLITNALRYGRGRAVHVRVESTPTEAVVSVRDHGMGISEQNLERVFNRFERAVDANDISGLGLGLYISRQIAAAHGGILQVTSQLDVGSTFRLELPFDPVK